MKIKSVEIYGYGQFVQRKVEFDQYFTEIFGQNEAVNRHFKRLYIRFYLASRRKRKTNHVLNHVWAIITVVV